MSEDGVDDQATPVDDYRSPALARLERAPRRPSPIRGIVEQPAPAVADERVVSLEARLATVEQQQRELVANLQQAHLAFRRLAERLASLSEPPSPPVELRTPR